MPSKPSFADDRVRIVATHEENHAVALPLFIRLWFAIDLALALSPPLHWFAGGGGQVFGLPAFLVYLFSIAVFIALSVIAAYFNDASLRDPSPRVPQ